MLNAIELLGKAKALLPTIRCRKTETSREMGHGEIKAYYISIYPKYLNIISPKTYYKCLISFLYTANTKYSIGSTTIPEMEVEP